MERAPARQTHRVRERAGDDERFALWCVDVERGRHQPGRIGVPGRSEHGARRPCLDEAAGVHHRQMLGDLADDDYRRRDARFQGQNLARNAAVAGVLNQMAHEKANLVNAVSIAEERGIRVNERKKSPSPRSAGVNALTMSLKTGKKQSSVVGTVLHGGEPRLLRIDEINIEAPLQGNIIYLRNRDVPGVIGRVGTVLGQHKVNIANFSLGRSEDEQEPREAVAVVQVDSEVNEAVLEDLRKIDAVEVAKAIRFS